MWKTGPESSSKQQGSGHKQQLEPPAFRTLAIKGSKPDALTKRDNRVSSAVSIETKIRLGFPDAAVLPERPVSRR
jgi:hypothetical protein